MNTHMYYFTVRPLKEHEITFFFSSSLNKKIRALLHCPPHKSRQKTQKQCFPLNNVLVYKPSAPPQHWPKAEEKNNQKKAIDSHHLYLHIT